MDTVLLGELVLGVKDSVLEAVVPADEGTITFAELYKRIRWQRLQQVPYGRQD